jgi:hypothetical protein
VHGCLPGIDPGEFVQEGQAMSNPFKNWTAADVAAFNAKVAQCPEVPVPGCDDESQLHNQILLECRRRGWIALHGSMAHRARRTPGEWDFVILADGGRTFYIEAKTRTGKQSTDQLALHHWARKLGHSPYVVRSFDEFLNIANA